MKFVRCAICDYLSTVTLACSCGMAIELFVTIYRMGYARMLSSLMQYTFPQREIFHQVPKERYLCYHEYINLVLRVL